MKFLFRVPLFDLDPNSEAEIGEHWDKILSAIANSSPTLYEETKQVRYTELRPVVQRKIFKYLLRGRYRSTPFGLWSAVGIGRFDQLEQTDLDLSEVANLSMETSFDLSENKLDTLHLSLGGIERMGRVHFLSYVMKERRWVFVSIPKNPLSSLLRDQSRNGKGITLREFQTWFEKSPARLSREMWDQLIELGILNNRGVSQNTQSSGKEYIDMAVKEELTLPDSMKVSLELFFQTAGSLFSEVPSNYLTSLKAWFRLKFDDRFVPLPLLLEYPDFVFSNFLEHLKMKPDMIEAFGQFYDNGQIASIDLKEILPLKPLDERIFDLALVFKKLNSKEIVVENLVCNRPFSFFGRFNKDERIYDYEQELKEKIFRAEAVAYAELRVFETPSVQGICDTKPLFALFISPFHETDSRALKLEDLEIGVRSDKFFLFHRKSGKRIIPIVTHPLNGKEISHPLIRLLWELELQDAFKFSPYQTTFFSKRAYTPQIQWGNIILQTRKWTVLRESHPCKEDLFRWMIVNMMPKRIRLGIYDRELIVEWHNKVEFEVFWSELEKNGHLTLSDPIWLDSREFKSKNGRYIYPEFVVNLSRAKKEEEWDGFVNSITEEDKTCLYILVRITIEELWDFLDFYFCRDLLDYLAQENIIWYYVVYPEGERLQVIIRFLRIREEVKKQLLWLGYGKFSQEHLDVELRPYYPEVKKYGKDGYLISEEVFHLESTLMMSQGSVVEPEMVIKLWQRLLEAVLPDGQIFKFLQSKVKKISYQEKKKLKMSKEVVDSDGSETLHLSDWMDTFHHLMLSQIRGAENEGEKLRRIGNHLHMQVNRFFPLERMEMENWIYLKLYGRFGKKVYAR